MTHKATKFLRGTEFTRAARQYSAEAALQADAHGLPRAYNLPLDAPKGEGEDVVIPRFAAKKKLHAADGS